MRQKKLQVEWWMICLGFVGSYTLQNQGYSKGAAVLMAGIALLLYRYRVQKTGSFVDLLGLFLLSFMGGIGVACLQLSALQSTWESVTWLCLFLGTLGVYIGFCVMDKDVPKESRPIFQKTEEGKKALLLMARGISGVSMAGLIIERIVCGFFPIFSKKPHAYSTFHVTGVHYFTISCAFLPALVILIYYSSVVISKKERCEMGWFLAEAILIPILCVSRFQLLFTILFGVVVYLLLYGRIDGKKLAFLGVGMVVVYVGLTFARHHDVAYLNGIFEMKNRNTPIFITQPYMYIANNFENFNCLVKELPKHSYGIKGLFPLWALTGLKFKYPQLTLFPVYITKKELTTTTIFYDGYYDFGVVGVFLLGLLIGLGMGLAKKWVQRGNHPVAYLFYGQMALYSALSFFTTWFSIPTTWFWFALTLLMEWMWCKKESIFRKGKVWQ